MTPLCTSSPLRPTRIASALSIFFLSLALVACGGGSKGGSKGGAAGTQAAASFGSVIAEGPILERSSGANIVVAGVAFDIEDAEIDHDGVSAHHTSLRLGMYVRVFGRLNGDSESGEAQRVIYDEEVEGPIEIVQVLGDEIRRFKLLGRDVLTTRSGTVFQGCDMDGLSVDDIIRVSGFENAVDRVRATRVVCGLGRHNHGTDIDTRIEIEGIVEDLVGGSFFVGPVEVIFDPSGGETDLSGVAGAPINGNEVEVIGVLEDRKRVFATSIEIDDDGKHEGSGSDEDSDSDSDGDGEDTLFHVEGLVSDFLSLADFRVASFAIDASGASFDPDQPDMIMNGTLVLVTGTLDDNGVLIAGLVELLASDGGDDVICDGVIADVTIGNLRVPDGATCILDHVTVDGGVRIGRDSTLDSIDTMVLGIIIGERSRQVILNHAWVGDDVRLTDVDDSGGSAVLITLSDIVGNVILRGNRGEVEVSLSFVGGDLRVANNQGAITLFDTTVDGSIITDSNVGNGSAMDIQLNTIKGDLLCDGNTPDPVGGNNSVVGSAQNQCIGFD